MDVKKVPLIEHNNRINVEDFELTTSSPSLPKIKLIQKNIICLKKYFDVWRKKVREKKEKSELVKVKIEQKEKLDNLVKALRKHQKQQQEKCEKAVEKNKNCLKQRPSTTYYKNCFEIQKDTIEKLNLKLEEKNKLIDELQMGIFHKDALKSIDNSKNRIREIFADCSVKIRCKVPPPVEYNEQFMISTKKAPKIIQQMEERAAERARKHEIIQQRKRIIEDKRKRMMEEVIEKKRVQDEEETKRNLDIMKERRRKEIEKDKIRQANKIIYLEKLNKAIQWHCTKLTKKFFGLLKLNYEINKRKEVQSRKYYETKMFEKSLIKWKNFVEKQYEDKYLLADALFARKIISKTFKEWKDFRLDCIRSKQVAEDFSDLRIQSSVFVNWHRFVCTEIVRRDKQYKFAEKHHNRRIVFQFFYQWRSLPAVMQLERAKEQKKRKWREKVLEILPDYKPPTD